MAALITCPCCGSVFELPSDPRMVFAEEAACILGISYQSVIHRIHHGKLTACKEGDRWLLVKEYVSNVQRATEQRRQDMVKMADKKKKEKQAEQAAATERRKRQHAADREAARRLLAETYRQPQSVEHKRTRLWKRTHEEIAELRQKRKDAQQKRMDARTIQPAKQEEKR